MQPELKSMKEKAAVVALASGLLRRLCLCTCLQRCTQIERRWNMEGVDLAMLSIK